MGDTDDKYRPYASMGYTQRCLFIKSARTREVSRASLPHLSNANVTVTELSHLSSTSRQVRKIPANDEKLQIIAGDQNENIRQALEEVRLYPS